MVPPVNARATFLIGLSGALVGAALTSTLRQSGKPIAVAALRQALLLQQNARLRWEELHEDLEDLRAEALHELHGEFDAEHDPEAPPAP
jgi:hypothetical protein